MLHNLALLANDLIELALVAVGFACFARAFRLTVQAYKFYRE